MAELVCDNTKDSSNNLRGKMFVHWAKAVFGALLQVIVGQAVLATAYSTTVRTCQLWRLIVSGALSFVKVKH